MSSVAKISKGSGGGPLSRKRCKKVSQQIPCNDQAGAQLAKVTDEIENGKISFLGDITPTFPGLRNQFARGLAEVELIDEYAGKLGVSELSALRKFVGTEAWALGVQRLKEDDAM